jgi:hypothetical protein
MTIARYTPATGTTKLVHYAQIAKGWIVRIAWSAWKQTAPDQGNRHSWWIHDWTNPILLVSAFLACATSAGTVRVVKVTQRISLSSDPNESTEETLLGDTRFRVELIDAQADSSADILGAINMKGVTSLQWIEAINEVRVFREIILI